MFGWWSTDFGQQSDLVTDRHSGTDYDPGVVAKTNATLSRRRSIPAVTAAERRVVQEVEARGEARLARRVSTAHLRRSNWRFRECLAAARKPLDESLGKALLLGRPRRWQIQVLAERYPSASKPLTRHLLGELNSVIPK